MINRRRALEAALVSIPFCAPPRAAAQASPPPSVASNLFAIEFRTGLRWDVSKPAHEQSNFREHSANLKRLRDSGALLLGARYADKGLIVIAAESEAAARAFIDVDPSVEGQVFAYSIHPFNVFYSGCIQAPKRATV